VDEFCIEQDFEDRGNSAGVENVEGVKFSEGLRSAMIGVRRLMRSMSSSVSFTLHSYAIAGRCRAEFVDPPVAAAMVTAFFKSFAGH